MAPKKLPQDPIQQIMTILTLLIILVIVSHLDFGALPGGTPEATSIHNPGWPSGSQLSPRYCRPDARP